MKTREIADLASKVLSEGGIVIYPTETCYGIGVDSTNRKAVEKLLKYKGDRKGKPISVAVSSKKMAEEYIEFNPQAENLFNNFLPGPITIVAQGKHKVDSKLESEDGKLGIRFPKHDLALQIIKVFGKPITATSANVSSGKTPYEIQKDILERIPDSKKELIDLILDVGKLEYHPPSTIVDTTLNDQKILRQGEFVMPKTAIKYVSENEVETIKIAEKITNDLPRGKAGKLLITNENKKTCLIFALQGDLGAGKTQFAKGVAKALGIKSKIKSPTFIICSEYPIACHPRVGGDPGLDFRFHGNDKAGRKFYHIDTWRMQNEQELYEIGFLEMLKPGNVIVIEWGEKVFGILREIEKNRNIKIIKIKIETIDESSRKIYIL